MTYLEQHAAEMRAEYEAQERLERIRAAAHRHYVPKNDVSGELVSVILIVAFVVALLIDSFWR